MLASRATQVRTLLLYAQDDKGLGHVNRTLTIARHLLAAYPNCVAYIATKSPLAGFTLPERCDYIKLPTLLTSRTIQQTEDEQEAAKQHFRKVRGQILRDAALGLAPDLVLVDHEPLGSKGEFREGLWALKAARPATRFVCGLRDIMDDPGRIRALWQEVGVYDVLQDLYDGIAVYGLPNLCDVAQAYAIPPSIQSKLHYCGYIVRDPPAVEPSALRRQHGLPERGPLVVATVGSGSDGYPVLDAAQAAVARLRAEGWPGGFTPRTWAAPGWWRRCGGRSAAIDAPTRNGCARLSPRSTAPRGSSRTWPAGSGATDALPLRPHARATRRPRGTAGPAAAAGGGAAAARADRAGRGHASRR